MVTVRCKMNIKNTIRARNKKEERTFEWDFKIEIDNKLSKKNHPKRWKIFFSD